MKVLQIIVSVLAVVGGCLFGAAIVGFWAIVQAFNELFNDNTGRGGHV